MPPVEETLASYLSMGKTSSLKTPSLPSVPLQVTSRLNGRAYAAAGQAVGALHTMAVLQAYQADLLKDLDKGQGLSPDEVTELRRTTDLALRATKQAVTAMGRSMGAMVVTERHLWVNLADLGKKERGFLPDAPVSPSELFGASVETLVEKFRRAQRPSKPLFLIGPDLSPNSKGVLARLVLRNEDRPRRLVWLPAPLPHLRVVLGGGTDQEEVFHLAPS
ncbi:Lamina-associated polypeptide 2, isoform alpha [Labeo rohita]|uniref:Lamina-associated polypeptide 2, isoform alpha n=1 Tax=Labeo rohita TaxID=84645 RepID=A0ABQ8LWH1_LABRO|nr:Lamina-associated polypeptide 2, isoform alpha [Labeo rohita]